MKKHNKPLVVRRSRVRFPSAALTQAMRHAKQNKHSLSKFTCISECFYFVLYGERRGEIDCEAIYECLIAFTPHTSPQTHPPASASHNRTPADNYTQYPSSLSPCSHLLRLQQLHQRPSSQKSLQDSP